MNKKRYLIGLLSLVAILITLSVSILQNDWFSWTQNALSDLGSSQANSQWIFNYGLIISGLLGVAYFSRLRKKEINELSKIGLIILIFDLFLLILIGVFPLGNYLHFPISISFFLLLPIGSLLYGLGRSKTEKNKGVLIILITLIMFFISFISLILFSGIAIPESTSILILATIIFVEK